MLGVVPSVVSELFSDTEVARSYSGVRSADAHSQVRSQVLIFIIVQKHCRELGVTVTDFTTSWKDGLALCALVRFCGYPPGRFSAVLQGVALCPGRDTLLFVVGEQ